MNSLFESVAGALKSTTLRNTGWSAIGSVANGAVGAVSSAILARTLGVDDFGTLILVLALLNLVTDLSDLGLSSALVKFGAEAEREGGRGELLRVGSTVLRLKMMLGGVVIAAAFMLSQPVVSYFFSHIEPGVDSLFRLSLIAAVLIVPASFLPAMMQATQAFRTYSIAMFSRYGSRLLLLLLCLLLVSHWTLELMVWVEIGSAVAFLLTGFFLSPKLKFTVSKNTAMEKKILGFGKWIVLYQMISLIGGKVDVFFVGGIADAASLGLYGAAMKIAGVVSVTTYSYFTALVPELSALPSAIAVNERRKNSLMIGMIMTAGIVVLALLADPLVSVFFGERYADAASLLQVICLGLVLNVVGHPYSAVLFSQNKAQVFPVGSAVAIAVFALANMLLISSMGVMGAAIAFVLQSLALLAVTLIYYRLWMKETGQ